MERLDKFLLREATLYKGYTASAHAKAVDAVQNDILKYVQDVGQRGNLEEIVATEKKLVKNELEHHANSKEMVSSLKTATAELVAAEKMIHAVYNKKIYEQIAKGYTLEKNRPQGLPLDEARQAFKSHIARLGNSKKVRGPDENKNVIDARKQNMLLANRLYIQQQAKTLGVSLQKPSRALSGISTQFKASLAQCGITEGNPNYKIMMEAFANEMKARSPDKEMALPPASPKTKPEDPGPTEQSRGR